MPVPSWIVNYYGPQEGSAIPLGGFASRGEEVVFWELVRRIGRESFRYNVQFGDIPYTMGREDRSAEFVLDDLGIVILVNSAFTHPDPLLDQLAASLIETLGFRVYFVWDTEVLPEMGGDVRAALDKIPGLAFFGSAVARQRSARRRLRRYGQPPRDITFRPTFVNWLGY